ncbi:hypothetical protein [Kribbella sp. CA-247076]|uniref:hypothetical protein n=1 Tax=Kribbella sp. CA-247076 TaxID=3239941 RepID=UPI003D91BD53
MTNWGWCTAIAQVPGAGEVALLVVQPPADDPVLSVGSPVSVAALSSGTWSRAAGLTVYTVGTVLTRLRSLGEDIYPLATVDVPAKWRSITRATGVALFLLIPPGAGTPGSHLVDRLLAQAAEGNVRGGLIEVLPDPAAN